MCDYGCGCVDWIECHVQAHILDRVSHFNTYIRSSVTFGHMYIGSGVTFQHTNILGKSSIRELPAIMMVIFTCHRYWEIV